MITAVFVYGTLKRGQCRETLWPVTPESVLACWTRGCLFDRHDYPAMTAGDDRVLGECWKFLPDDMPEVLRILDAIEGTNQPGQPDLYDRVTTPVWDLQDCPLGEAYTYHYAGDPSEDGFVRLISNQQDGAVSWPAT